MHSDVTTAVNQAVGCALTCAATTTSFSHTFLSSKSVGKIIFGDNLHATLRFHLHPCLCCKTKAVGISRRGVNPEKRWDTILSVQPAFADIQQRSFAVEGWYSMCNAA
jgi:hypothetical protein